MNCSHRTLQMMLLPLSNHLNPPFDTFDYKTKYRTFDYKTIQCKIHQMWSLLNSLKLTQTWKHLDHLKFKPAVSRHCPLDGYGLRTKKLSASISLIYYLLHLPDEVKNKKILTIKYMVNVQGIWNSKLLYEGTAIWMGVYYQSVGFEQKDYL